MTQMNLYETIYVRRSVRNYLMEPLEERTMQQIRRFIDELVPLFPDIGIKIEIIKALDKPRQVKGLFYPKAPYYLAFYSENKEKYELNAGFSMEQIALYLGSKGVGSCFLGAAQTKKKVEEDSGLHFVILMAFGKPKEKYERPDYEAKRLDLKELCVYKETPRTWVKEVLEAARLAPSDYNSQPWRFVVYENRIHVFEKKMKIGKRVRERWTEFDFGIMLSHVMVVTEERWVDIDLIRLDNISHKTVPNNEYIISIILRP